MTRAQRCRRAAARPVQCVPQIVTNSGADECARCSTQRIPVGPAKQQPNINYKVNSHASTTLCKRLIVKETGIGLYFLKIVQVSEQCCPQTRVYRGKLSFEKMKILKLFACARLRVRVDMNTC